MIIDCNGQANVLVSAIKCRPVSALMGQPVYFFVTGCAYVARASVCVDMDLVGWIHAMYDEHFISQVSWNFNLGRPLLLCISSRNTLLGGNPSFFPWSLNTSLRIHNVVYRWYPVWESLNSSSFSRGCEGTAKHLGHIIYQSQHVSRLNREARPHRRLFNSTTREIKQKKAK